MIECPDYGDPILVPSGWYKHIESTQIVYHAHEYGYEGELSPVVLRGSRFCRIRKYRAQSDYGHTVIMRLLRMKRITETDQSKWYDWCRAVLFPMCWKQPWWHNQRSLSDISCMLRDYLVLIDGELVSIYDKTQMANVKKLAAAIKKVDKMEKLRLTSCKP